MWRAFSRAQVPAVKEPVDLTRDDGKRLDGVTLVPWARGKPLALDVTVPDTCADSYLTDTATIAGAAADMVASTKEAKYRQLVNSHMFVPVAGTWNHLAVELIQELGRIISAVTQVTREAGFLFQRLSVRGFATGKCGLLPHHFHHTINVAVVVLLFFNIFCLQLLLPGQKNNNSNNKDG